MAAFKSYRSQMNQLIEDFEEELFELYHSTEAMDLTPTPKKSKSKGKSTNASNDLNEGDALSTSNELIDVIRRAKIVKFDDRFDLILYETTDGYIWIDVKTVLKHISLIDKVTKTQSRKSSARMDTLKERVEEVPLNLGESFSVKIKGIFKQPVEAIFVPVCDLMLYSCIYRDNLLKFMSKKFVNGDDKGWIYYNHVINDDTGRHTDVKVGRTKNLRHRNQSYNSQARGHSEHLVTMRKIYVSERGKAEDIWKFYLEKNSDKIASIVQDSEWLRLSDDDNEANAQAEALESIWNEYINSEEIKAILLEKED